MAKANLLSNPFLLYTTLPKWVKMLKANTMSYMYRLVMQILESISCNHRSPFLIFLILPLSWPMVHSMVVEMLHTSIAMGIILERLLIICILVIGKVKILVRLLVTPVSRWHSIDWYRIWGLQPLHTTIR